MDFGGHAAYIELQRSTPGVAVDVIPSRALCRGRGGQASTCNEGSTMATYISLINFTDQGIRSVKESPNRAEAFTGLAGSSA